MPHTRKRHLETPLRHALKFSPLVGVFGHRQVGKTTLLTQISPSYFSLDQPETQDEVNEGPSRFLKSIAKTSPVGLDECQHAPRLFPALKEWVRLRKSPGQFILSGSVRFTSKQTIRESLTGRILMLELFPFLQSEINQTDQPDRLIDLLKREDWKTFDVHQQRSLTQKAWKHGYENRLAYFSKGGLPGACMIRDEKFRKQRFEDQIETILTRDLQTLVPSRLLYPELRRLLATLANHQGNPLQLQALKRISQITPPTLKRLLYALDGLFLIRSLPIEGTLGGKTYFFEDVGERAYLSQGTSLTELDLFTHYCFVHVHGLLNYEIGQNFPFFQYRTRGGALVPFAVKSERGEIGFIPIVNESPSRSKIASAKSFLSAYQGGKILMISHVSKKVLKINDRILVVPADWAFS